MSANYSWTDEVPIEDRPQVEVVTTAAAPAPTAVPVTPGAPATGEATPWVPRVMPWPVPPVALVAVTDAPAPAVESPAIQSPAITTVVDAPALPVVTPIADPVAAPAVAKPVTPRRTPVEKRKLTRLERFRVWVGRPLLATIAFGGLIALGLPVIGATYTRESANPMDWRNLSAGEVQARVQYCFGKNGSATSAIWCDYGHAADAGGLSPRMGRIKKTVVQVPYPVAGPVVYDVTTVRLPDQPVSTEPIPVSGPPATGTPVRPPVSGPPADGAPGGGGQPVQPPATGAGPYPIIQFPAGPMAAIESTCEGAKQAAQQQSPAYQQNVEMQCEAAKQAYERAHP